MILAQLRAGVERSPAACAACVNETFVRSILVSDSTRTARIRSRSTPASASAIWASTTPNLTPRLNREPRVSSARYFSRRASAFSAVVSWICPSSRTSSRDQVVEQVEDRRRQHVHAEEAKVMTRAQAGQPAAAARPGSGSASR